MSLDTTPDEGGSLELIRACELYPKPAMKSDSPSLIVPFPVLCGESVRYLGTTADGLMALSNFRLFVRQKKSFINVPLGLIEMVECRDIFYLYIYCKDAHSFRCTFHTNQSCMEWYNRVANAILPPSKLTDTFSFVFHAWCKSSSGGKCSTEMFEQEIGSQLCKAEDTGAYSFGKEVERLGFNLKKVWRISYINENFDLSGTYPQLHVVPSDVEDKELRNAASFRACKRFPSVVWRHQKNGAVIARSSQPEVGWLGWRNKEDEQLLQAILNACITEAQQQNGIESSDDECSSMESSSGDSSTGSASKQMLIVDARSYTAAVANRAKGGGCECIEYYPSCEIQFMSLANIHTIRKSFHALRALCSAGTDQHSWLTGLENTRWLSHMSSLLRSALLVVHAVHKEGRPVLVHCSDGWDRTPQIVALAQIMLDPYYRTIEGFRVLVEREWLEFGHKFADRCGIGQATDDVNERCPVFLQWLDCVHQMLNQFPCAFQFNHAYLVKLAQHTYSNLFGTFLCNNVKERIAHNLKAQSTSLWTMLGAHNRQFVNALYQDDSPQIIQPSPQIRDLSIWRSVYLSEGSVSASESTCDPLLPEETVSEEESTGTPPVSKTRSCENLAVGGTLLTTGDDENSDMGPRRLSDPNVVPPPQVQPHSHSAGAIDSRRDSTNTAPVDITTAALMQNEQDKHTQNGISSTEASKVSLSNGHISSNESFKSVPSSITPLAGECNGVGAVNGLCDNRQVPSEAAAAANDNGYLANNNHDSDDEEPCVLKGEEEEEEDLTNGHVTKDGSPSSMRITRGGRASVEGSTETLTGMDDHRPAASRYAVSSSHPSNISSMSATDPGDAAAAAASCGVSPKLQPKLAAHHQHMSTSTSDISDSYIKKNIQHKNGVNSTSSTKAGALKMGSKDLSLNELHSVLPLCGLAENVAVAHGLQQSGLKVDIGRCHSSGVSTTDSEASGSPSPGNEPKCCGSTWAGRSMARQLDVDGLTQFLDPVQQHMSSVETAYSLRVHQLERKVHLLTMALNHMSSNGGSTPMESVSMFERDIGPSSHQPESLGGEGSDASWEQVDEAEAELTKWIPNHAVTHCAGCDSQFWVALRKHHCRKCGRIFCSDCSQNFVPVPEQQLEMPVRVCNKCYSPGTCEESISSPSIIQQQPN